MALALKAPFMATTGLLSGSFYGEYELSILLALLYESDVAPELFNINENKPMQPSTIYSRKQISFFSVAEHKGLDKRLAAWKLRLIPLVLPN